jgi:putative tryptophan/tyrosine transport system substrate-binding protein
MRRRDFITVMGGAVAVWPFAARAQQPTGKAARIGYLAIRSPTSAEEAFLQGLRELGWIEGQNIFIERRYAAGSSDRLKSLPENWSVSR